MGYIDKEFGIKTAKGLEKHLKTIIGRDIIVLKVPDSLRVIWSVNDKLLTYDIKGSVIYVIKTEQVFDAITFIIESIKSQNKSL